MVEPSAPASAAVAATCTVAAFVQLAEPPVMVTTGAVRSSHTGTGDDQAERLPARSLERNSTTLLPSAEITVDDPAVVAVQLAPSSALVRNSKGPRPEPPASVEREVGVTVVDAAFDHAPAPAATPGTVGSTLSITAVPAGSPAAGAQGETLPALSTPRNCTQVVPVVATVNRLPLPGVDQCSPASALVRYW